MSAMIIINSLITIIACYSNICLNLILLLAIFFSKRVACKPELSLFYTRFAADIGYSISISTLKIYILAAVTSKIFVVKNFIFITMWATVIFGIIRTSLLFLTSVDRVIAIYLPVFYYTSRPRIPLFAIFFLIFCLIIFDQFVMFGYCQNTIDTPIDCDNFKCTFNNCYKIYWVSHEQIMFSVIVVLTILLTGKLVVHTLFAKNNSAQVLSRATQIAMLDSTTLIIFNLVPVSSYFWYDSVDFSTYTSFTTLSRNLGFLVNTLIIFRIFMKNKNTVAPVALSTPSL